MGAATLLIVVFAATSRYSRNEIAGAVHSSGSSFQLDDIILTPMPSNFFCWNLITAEHGAGSYRLRRGTFAPFPGVFPVRDCPRFRSQTTVAPLRPVQGDWGTRFQWEGEFSGEIAALLAAQKNDCQFAALLRFSRAPYLIDTPRGKTAGDLRYDFGPEPSFAGLLLPSTECPSSVPPWREPRGDWLRAG
jgi:hypothetical protein